MKDQRRLTGRRGEREIIYKTKLIYEVIDHYNVEKIIYCENSSKKRVYIYNKYIKISKRMVTKKKVYLCPKLMEIPEQ